MATLAERTTPAAVASKRLISLDVMRGITVAFMIMVNNNGDSHAFWFMKHAQWNGFTPTDLVFPTFLFLVGTSLVFSYDSRLSRGISRTSLALHTLKRACIIFLLGLVVNGFPHFPLHTLRIYGVLQRIAVCFLIAGLLYLWDRRATSKIAIIVAALVGYYIIMRWVPVPGYGLPGRDVPFLDPDGNMVAWLDRHIFPNRLYEHVRDPEGLLSDLPALATTLLGVLTGIWLKSTRTARQKFGGMAIASVCGILAGALWNPWFPINKKLWTSSYVLFAAGLSLLGLALCYWAVEVKGWKKGWTTFWLVFGMNTISAYVFSELLGPALDLIHIHVNGHTENPVQYLYPHLWAHLGPGGFPSLMYSISYMLVCWIPMAILYKKKIFIKI
jgi:predicted acyltransferase